MLIPEMIVVDVLDNVWRREMLNNGVANWLLIVREPLKAFEIEPAKFESRDAKLLKTPVLLLNEKIGFASKDEPERARLRLLLDDNNGVADWLTMRKPLNK